MNRHHRRQEKRQLERKSHWERVYRTKSSQQLSWHQAHPATSLELIAAAAPGRDAPLIDVGGGDSTLVDHLLDLGYRDLTVLDVAPAALDRARQRLAARAGSVSWIVGDVTRFAPPRRYRLWHDRATFHFLTEPEERQHYRRVLREAVEDGGQLIIAAFAPQAPPRCSGLDVVRYDPESLTLAVGQEFQLIETTEESHTTPAGACQPFIYCRFTRRSR